MIIPVLSEGKNILWKADIMKDVQKGGLNVIYFAIMHEVLKLKRCVILCSMNYFGHWHDLSENGRNWFVITMLLWPDNFEQCLPGKLSDLYQQVLLQWNLTNTIYLLNSISPWNNRSVLKSKKTMLFGTWVGKMSMDCDPFDGWVW